MCRLYGFSASEKTGLECSLLQAHNSLFQQSRNDSLGRSNPDGWGISFYESGKPSLEKGHGMAADDPRYKKVASSVRSNIVISHIRLATVGATEPQNVHPFVYGVWSFAHNGTVSGFPELEELLIQETDPLLQRHRLGSTDSEQVFYWLLTRMQTAGISLDTAIGSNDQSEKVFSILASSAKELMTRSTMAQSEVAKLNFLLTDGNEMFATRWNNSLHVAQRQGTRDCQVCQLDHVHQDAPNYRAVVIASEPITEEPWQEIENESVCHIDSEQNFRSAKIEDVTETDR